MLTLVDVTSPISESSIENAAVSWRTSIQPSAFVWDSILMGQSDLITSSDVHNFNI